MESKLRPAHPCLSPANQHVSSEGNSSSPQALAAAHLQAWRQLDGLAGPAGAFTAATKRHRDPARHLLCSRRAALVHERKTEPADCKVRHRPPGPGSRTCQRQQN